MCAQERDRQGGTGFGNTNESRMRRATLFSVPVEMRTVREEEESNQGDEMKECTGREEYGGERFVRISLEEMESYYRCAQCCQRLISEFCRDVIEFWRVHACEGLC